jgi:5-methyltetrahydrofolate--homocysteine methyltransferase
MGDFSQLIGMVQGAGLTPQLSTEQFYGFVAKLIADGADPKDILEQGLMPGMKDCISRFPFMLFTAHNFYRVFPLIKPALFPNGKSAVGKVLICAVKDDNHRPGKDLVKMMIETKGIEVIDLGVNCAPDKIVAAVKDSGAKVLCLSSLLPNTMYMFGETITALKKAGLRNNVKIMVGGPLVTQKFADEIGADGYAPEGISAAEVCRGYFQ